MFHLKITAETPGRPLTRDECDTLLSPFGMAPPDKGGGTGLALYVARGLARGLGGDLVIETDRDDATSITVRMPLRASDAGMLSRSSSTASQMSSRNSSTSEFLLDGAEAATPDDFDSAMEVELTSRMFECLLTNSDDVFAICRLTPDANEQFGVKCAVEYISPSVERGLSYCQQAVVGCSLLSVCLPEDRPAFGRAIAAAHRGDGPEGHNIACMHRSVTATGGSVWCHTCGLVDGDLMYLVCRDVRARKSVEIALRAFTLATTHDVRECCNAVLVSTAVLEKRDCIAAAAFSFPPSPPPAADESEPRPQSPPVVAAAAAAKAEERDLEPRFLVDCINNGCALILGIIGNVLTAPQLEEGHVEMEAVVFSPQDLLRDVMQACRMGCAAAAQPGGSVVEWGKSKQALPPLIECDRSRLAQIVQNITTNACKFGLGKPVTVHAELQDAAAPSPAEVSADAVLNGDEVEAQPWLCVHVRDRGRGMSAEEAASCFVAGKAAPKAAGGGTGLGLYISCAFAQLMGGTLRVAETSLGGGSTFELRVPVRVLGAHEVAAAVVTAAELDAAAAEDARAAQHRIAERAAADPAKGATAEGATSSQSGGGSGSSRGSLRFHALLADDHPLNLRLVSRLLQLQGFEVTAVADGGAALDALCSNGQVQSGVDDALLPTPFDLAILDMNMPVMSGPDVAAAFRAWEAQVLPAAMRLPIIALTANVMEEHVAECASAGMDLFLSKPLRECSVPVLRAHAAAHAEYRAVASAAHSATADAVRATKAAAAAAKAAHTTLGLGALEPTTPSAHIR